LLGLTRTILCADEVEVAPPSRRKVAGQKRDAKQAGLQSASGGVKKQKRAAEGRNLQQEWIDNKKPQKNGKGAIAKNKAVLVEEELENSVDSDSPSSEMTITESASEESESDAEVQCRCVQDHLLNSNGTPSG
jgi:hypothetical protein